MEDAYLIRKIPSSQFGSVDRLIWKCAFNGIFSVKSAYHMQGEVQDKIKGQSSPTTSQEEGWKHL